MDIFRWFWLQVKDDLMFSMTTGKNFFFLKNENIGVKWVIPKITQNLAKTVYERVRNSSDYNNTKINGYF